MAGSVSHQRIGKGTVNKRTSRDYPKYIIKIGHNTEKSSGDARILSVAQTPVKNQLTPA